MDATSRFIYEQLQHLRLNVDQLFRTKQDLCSLNSVIECQTDLIEKVLKKGQLPLPSIYASADAKRKRGVVEDELNLKSKSMKTDAPKPSSPVTQLMMAPSSLDFTSLEQDIWELRLMIHRFSQEAEFLHMDHEKVHHIKAIVESGCEFLNKAKLSSIGGAKVTPSFMYGQLQILIQKIDLFLQTEDSLDKMRKKFSVEDHFDLIEKLFKERQIGGVAEDALSSGPFPVSNLVQARESLGQFKEVLIEATSSSTDNLPPSFNDQDIWDMRERISLFFHEACAVGLGTGDEKIYQRKGIVEDLFDYLPNGQLPATIGDAKEPRFLLVSSGCAICLLDLKLGKEEPLSNADDVRPLPIVATLRLLEEQLPVSVGLFRLRSGAYMIGGHMFPSMIGEHRFPAIRCYKDNPSSGELYECLLKSRLPLKGTSCATYCLTLEDGLLSHSKCNIMELQNPKFWPIVEEVDGQVHVFDSDPYGVVYPHCDWMFSHEILERDGGSWSIIPTPNHPLNQAKYFIRCHLVLGHKIYAIAARECLLFDSRKKKWEIVDRKRDCDYWSGPFNVECVWDILLLCRFAWKVGEIGLGGLEPYDRLYVILALQSELHSMSTVVYIVASTGQVVCIQRLPHLFSMGPMEPGYMLSGTMTKADEETMCVILNAFPSPGKGSPKDGAHLFIFTFTVKELRGAASKFMTKPPRSWEELRMSGASASDFMSKRLEEYVRVDIKDTYIFRTNADFQEEAAGMQSEFMGIRACFMDGNAACLL